MRETEKVQICKNNMKIYPIYRALSLDIIFIYAIRILFLTQVKNISVSDIIISESFFAFFMILLQFPSSILIKKLGHKQAAILSNVLTIIYITIIIFSANLTHLIIAEIFSAISFSIKNISDPTLLNLSIPKTDKKSEIFSKIEGKGTSRYYYIDAMTAIIAGFLYAVNPYLPFIASIITALFAIHLAFRFKEIKEENDSEEEHIKISEYARNIKEGFSFIFKSERLKYLLIYCGIIWGILSLMTTYRTSLLTDLEVSPQVIGIIIAILGFASGIGAKIQKNFHNKYRNKSLSYLAIAILISIIIPGIIVLLELPYLATLLLIVLCFVVMKMGSGIYSIITKRYLSNFTDNRIIDKIYSAESIISNLFRIIIALIGSWIIGQTNTALAMIIVGIVFLAIIVRLLFAMRTRVGLKPEEYDKTDIKYKNY